MFEHVILVASMIPDKKVREEKLPRLVFHELDVAPAHEAPRRFWSRRQAAGSGK